LISNISFASAFQLQTQEIDFADVSHLDENTAALWVWLNSCKSDDVWTNVFSTSTKS